MFVNKAVRQKIFNCHKKLNLLLPCHVHQPKRTMRNPTFGVCKQQICISSALTYARTYALNAALTDQQKTNEFGQLTCADPEEGRGDMTHPPNNHKKGFLSNTGQDPLKNHKTTKPAMMGHHRPASEIPFKWRFDDGTMISRL